MGRFLIGTSGWNYPHWRGRFYPRGLPADEWLTYYAGQFPTVEVNYTFYRLPERRTFVAWHAAAPRRFIFALKASRFITHVRRLRDARGPVGRLLTRARPLAQALGPILFQLAPTFACDEERLAAFLARLPSGRRYAVEFRHESWHREPVYRLLRRHGVACCVCDTPRRPCHIVRTAPFVYARFHHSGTQDGCYTEDQLRRWADGLRDVSGRGAVYAYFNNDWEGFAVKNAARLAELLSAGGSGRKTATRPQAGSRVPAPG
jgi:uncharacterized protein YecE (DUF72 family)